MTTDREPSRWPLALALLLTACAGRETPDSSSDRRALVNLLDEGGVRRVTPSLPGAAAYQSEPAASRQLAAVDDPLRVALIQTIAAAGKERGVSVLPDTRLDAVMADLARTLRGEEQPLSGAVEFLLAHYGVVEPYPRLHILRVHESGEAQLAAELQRTFSLPALDRLVTVGVGADRSTSMITVVLAVQPKFLDLEPVARLMSAAEPVMVRGRLLDRFTAPRLYITDPTGKAREFAVTASASGFTAAVRCDRGAGAYQIEVFGDDASGPRVLANFPVYCDAAAPQAHDGPAGYTAELITAEAAEAGLLARINEARAAAGLPAVVNDPQLATVARAHSRDMHEHDFVAHISPTTGTPMDRVQAAGINVARLLENIGTAGSVDEVHAGLMRSPGHRKAILDTRASHVGVGVIVTAPSGVVSLVATQLFR